MSKKLSLVCSPRRFLALVGFTLVLLFLLKSYITTPALLRSADTVWRDMSEQQRRGLALQRGCHATRHLRPATYSLLQLIQQGQLDHLIVDDVHRLIYCYVPKVASSQWKKVLAILTGKTNETDTHRINTGSVHRRAMHRYLHEYTPREIRARLASYRNFLFVRHPLVRLASGYRNKFSSKTGYFNKHFSSNIRRRFGDSSTTDDVTFQAFIRWVTEREPRDPRGQRNEHWRPMADLCHPCLIHYSIIGHMDTLKSDSELVLNAIGADHIIMDYSRDGSTSSSEIFARESIPHLPQQVIEDMLRYYRQDFTIFDYQPSSIFSNNATAEENLRHAFNKLSFQPPAELTNTNVH